MKIEKLFGMFLLGFLLMANVANTQVVDDNEYVTVRAWIRIMQENGWGEWQEVKKPPIEDFSLKIGQPVQIKIEIMPKQDSWVETHISETGIGFNFDIKYISPYGNQNFIIRKIKRDNQSVYWINIKQSEIIGVIWTIAPNSNWVGGTAGITLHYIIKKAPPHADETLTGNFFTVIYPYIENEEWTGPTVDEDVEDNNSGGKILGFVGTDIVYAIALAGMLFAIWRRRRMNE